MAVINPAPIALNDIVLTVGSDNYEVTVSRVELVPTTNTVQWRGMTPTATYNVASTPTWTLNLDFAQDFVTANSMSEYLRTNQGTVKTVAFKPKKGATGATPTFTIDALMVPGSIGGSVDTVAVASVSLPCNGQPVRSLT